MTSEVQSSIDLFVQTAIDNVRKLGDVRDMDFQLLERILPHCTLEQLKHVEDSTKGRDLSPVTNGLWKKFFQRQFGAKNVDLVVERMEKAEAQFSWRQLYEAKLKEQEDKEQRLSARMREMYKIEETKKRNRQIQLCGKIPPSTGRKRSCASTSKTNIMKKAKLEFLNSTEVKNLAAMRIKVVPRTNGVSPATRTSSQYFCVSSSAPIRKTKLAAGKRF